MCRDNQTFKLFQEVHRRTIAENRAFDQAFSQLPPEAQRLIDKRLGELLYATIEAAAQVASNYKNRSELSEG
ncbi:hypothetical protein E6Q11_02720 [Candidatus Dojkabacteria bacterium]|uniref:Uncharacterized protein n=1 Tax=Candidatus Dojkabacteria bacterium TaxID=2099670 RepID=A0A5C7JAA1_9BACT|nr:MAG: hypothetical protein E6Q11_02720 [Candidatus Dojkabacteria bacterium]